VIIKCANHRPGRTIFGVPYHSLLNFSNLRESNSELQVATKYKTAQAHLALDNFTSKNLMDVSALPVAKYFPSGLNFAHRAALYGKSTMVT